MSDKGRTAYYFRERTAEPQPAIIRADYGPNVKGQLGDGTHRTAPWRWVIPSMGVGDFFAYPAGAMLPAIDLDQLEADIAMGKRLPGGDDPGEPEPDGPMEFDHPPDRDPGDEDDHGKPGHTPGTDPRPDKGNDGNGHQQGGKGHSDPQPTKGNDGQHGHAPPSAPPQSPASAPGKSGEAPGHGGEGHGKALGHNKHGKDK